MSAPETFDPTATAPTLGDLDLHLFSEGTHRRAHDLLGAHVRTLDGVSGTSFAVWAPNAESVDLVGDFNGWTTGRHPLRPLGATGVHEAFVPGLGPGTLYKFAIHTRDGRTLLKTDPYGRFTQQPPGHASIVVGPPAHAWGDEAWLARRARSDPHRSPVAVYEVHLGSWFRHDGEPLSYAAIAGPLADRVADLGFTHVELLPVMEHPFGGSWGYQVTGYYAPTSRWGDPDDLRALIDQFHRRGLGVILDWVPAHFPRDPHGLARFDGTALYEHEDPRQGLHPDWDTAIFNFGRGEVVSFLVGSALHWLESYHVDGLRVDAVASMLHLNYSRDDGEWVANAEGGSENWDAVKLLRRVNELVREEFPGVVMIAEESTTWPGVTAPLERAGLGFHFKWNMGWMHDTLDFFRMDPLYRGGHLEKLTFSMMYEHSEHFLMPLSHDEVVHGKGSLLGKMHGDEWQRFANLRALLAYQYSRPGKLLLFMGTELASAREWDHDAALDWHLIDEPARLGMQRLVAALGRLYAEHPCLWRGDPDPEAFRWIECDDRRRCVFAYERWDGHEHLVVVLNLTPVPHEGYRLGVPGEHGYSILLDSDAAHYGGSGFAAGQRPTPSAEPSHARGQSLVLDLPPLSALVLAPRGPGAGHGGGSTPGDAHADGPAEEGRRRGGQPRRKASGGRGAKGRGRKRKG